MDSKLNDIEDNIQETKSILLGELELIRSEIYNTKISFICELIIVSYGVYGLIQIYKYFF